MNRSELRLFGCVVAQRDEKYGLDISWEYARKLQPMLRLEVIGTACYDGEGATLAAADLSLPVYVVHRWLADLILQGVQVPELRDQLGHSLATQMELRWKVTKLERRLKIFAFGGREHERHTGEEAEE